MSLIKNNESNWLPLLLDDAFKNDWLGGTTKEKSIGINVPAVNIIESEETFALELAAPGKAKEDFLIELDNDILSISSENKNSEDKMAEDRKFTRKEFNYASFKRAFNLPDSVDSSKISASYTNGVLEINLPKKEEAKVQAKRAIEIS